MDTQKVLMKLNTCTFLIKDDEFLKNDNKIKEKMSKGNFSFYLSNID